MSISKICMHWTAGSNNPCQTDIDAYHFIFDSAGKEFKGKFAPEDNINCKDGKYAKHCGGGNTGCIGLSCCGMAGFDWLLHKIRQESKRLSRRIASAARFVVY